MSEPDTLTDTVVATTGGAQPFRISYRNIVLSVLLSLAVVVVVGAITYEPEAIRLIWEFS
jgi:hypothetical protein